MQERASTLVGVTSHEDANCQCRAPRACGFHRGGQRPGFPDREGIVGRDVNVLDAAPEVIAALPEMSPARAPVAADRAATMTNRQDFFIDLVLRLQKSREKLTPANFWRKGFVKNFTSANDEYLIR